VFVAALWWGALTLLAAVVVPLLFKHLATPALAGNMAAKLFTAQTGVSALCGVLLLLLGQRSTPAQASRGWILGGTLLALMIEFAIAPHIVARDNLALWHGLGTAFFVLQWACATVTLWHLSLNQLGTEPNNPVP
jgi:hypothetical protein